MVSGSELNTGIRAFFAAAMIGSDAVETVMSPLIQIASAPRASTEPAASMAPVELSALASISSMAEIGADLARDGRLGHRVRLGRVPDESHSPESGTHRAGHAEDRFDRLQAAVAGQVRRMLEMVLAADPDTRTVGIADQAEHVPGLGSRFVRPRHGLQRDGAHAEDEIVTAAGHLPRDGVRRGDVVFRAKAAQLYAVSVSA